MNNKEQKAFDELWEAKVNIINNYSSEYSLSKAFFEAGIKYCKDNKGTDNHFEEFWLRYPVKVKKKPTKEIWKRKGLDKVIDIILADLTKRKESDSRWADGFIPDPTTYLNQERWTDEIQQKKKITERPRTNDEWIKKGNELGIQAMVGESMSAYKARISARL